MAQEVAFLDVMRLYTRFGTLFFFECDLYVSLNGTISHLEKYTNLDSYIAKSTKRI